jgi:hypothetical protein
MLAAEQTPELGALRDQFFAELRAICLATMAREGIRAVELERRIRIAAGQPVPGHVTRGHSRLITGLLRDDPKNVPSTTILRAIVEYCSAAPADQQRLVALGTHLLSGPRLLHARQRFDLLADQTPGFVEKQEQFFLKLGAAIDTTVEREGITYADFERTARLMNNIIVPTAVNRGQSIIVRAICTRRCAMIPKAQLRRALIERCNLDQASTEELISLGNELWEMMNCKPWSCMQCGSTTPPAAGRSREFCSTACKTSFITNGIGVKGKLQRIVRDKMVRDGLSIKDLAQEIGI